MAKIDDLIKELRDAIKDPKDAKKGSYLEIWKLMHQICKFSSL